jgi:hypothetical protein
MVRKVNFETFRIFENHGYIPNPVVWNFSPLCNWVYMGLMPGARVSLVYSNNCITMVTLLVVEKFVLNFVG